MYNDIIILNINESVFDELYLFFLHDFVYNNTYLNNDIYINPRSHLKEDGKEKDFWHLVTKEQYNKKNKERLLDTRRAERLRWVKRIIENHTHESIKLFYHFEEKSNKIRLYLWAYEYDFVVIIQKLGRKNSFLVTSFYINYGKKRADFKKRYDNYINGKDDRLKGCEWF